MAGDESAFAVLGLEPGADPAAIDEAYRRLIKLHHPDREGGDGARAAEIIHAYRELRGRGVNRNPLILVEQPEQRRGRRGWAAAAIGGVAAIGVLVVLSGPVALPLHRLWPSPGAGIPLVRASAGGPAAIAEPMDQPLHLGSIDAAIREATIIARTRDEMALASASDACQQRFRGSPSVNQLDRCAAFDDAAVEVQDRDPLRDQGPFAEIAVTGRQWSAASALSSDYLAVDSRLGRIRLRVQLALAAAEDAARASAPQAAAQPASENSDEENSSD
jgi:hypothetical protein